MCSYITPLRAGRLLDSPRQAMRFVSLLRYEKQQALGGGDKLEQWSSLHAFLARNKGVSYPSCCLLLISYLEPCHHYEKVTGE